MRVRTTGAFVFVCLLICVPASARMDARFILDEAVQKATHVVVVEAGDDGFRVVESWAGDLAAGAVLDCLDLYSVDSAQYARVAAEEPPEPAVPEGPHPVLVDELVFVPEGAKVILFLREIRGDSGYAVPTAELLPERGQQFASVSPMWPRIVTSMVWSAGEDVFQFGTVWGEGPQWLQPMYSQSKGEDGKHLPMKLAELKGLVASREGNGEPGDADARTAEEAEWRTRAKRVIKACQFRDVAIRLFRNGEVAGADHEQATGQILGTRIAVPAESVPETGVFLCVPDDQPDPVVAEALSNHVQLWGAKQQARLNPWDFSPESQKAAQVLDALGEPLPGARVSLAMQKGYRDSATEPVLLCERQTDENGEIELLALPPGRDGVPEWHYAPFVISHTDYGLTQVRWHGDAVNGERTLRTSLLREGSEARERALHGVVVGPDAKPVAGAVVTSESIRPPGLLINGDATAVTDGAGRFCLYLPRRDWAGQPDKGAEVVPPHSKYSYSVAPPEGSGLRSAGGWASNDEPVTITLESEAAFVARGSVHTFTFEGGFPEGAGFDAGVWVAIHSDDANFGVHLVAPDEEHLIPYGTYYGHIESGKRGSEYISFAPIVVNAESPKELAFRKIRANCAGQVIDGVTGKPMAGVLCLVGAEGFVPMRLTFDDVPEPLRQAMAREGVSQEEITGLAEPLGRDFSLLAAAVTDKDGRYDVAVPPGRDIRLVYAIAEGYVPTARDMHSGNPTDERRYDLGPIPLYPAARARVRIGGGLEGECLVTWQADEAETGDWAVPLRGYGDSVRHSLEIMAGRFDAGGGDATFLIPASAPLHLTIYPPDAGPTSIRMIGDAGLIPVRVAEAVRVAPGQVVDLGEVRFAKAYDIPAAVRVVDEQGNPVEGVPIRKLSGDCWSFPCLTDEEGLAKFEVSPGITEKVGISCVGVDLAFAVAPDLDAAAQIEHTFNLSAEQLKALFRRESVH